MYSHALAKILLEQPNMPVAINLYNHVYLSLDHHNSHGPLKVSLIDRRKCTGVWSNQAQCIIHKPLDHIAIGNFSEGPDTKIIYKPPHSDFMPGLDLSQCNYFK